MTYLRTCFITCWLLLRRNFQEPINKWAHTILSVLEYFLIPKIIHSDPIYSYTILYVHEIVNMNKSSVIPLNTFAILQKDTWQMQLRLLEDDIKNKRIIPNLYTIIIVSLMETFMTLNILNWKLIWKYS